MAIQAVLTGLSGAFQEVDPPPWARHRAFDVQSPLNRAGAHGTDLTPLADTLLAVPPQKCGLPFCSSSLASPLVSTSTWPCPSSSPAAGRTHTVAGRRCLAPEARAGPHLPSHLPTTPHPGPHTHFPSPQPPLPPIDTLTCTHAFPFAGARLANAVSCPRAPPGCLWSRREHPALPPQARLAVVSRPPCCHTAGGVPGQSPVWRPGLDIRNLLRVPHELHLHRVQPARLYHLQVSGYGECGGLRSWAFLEARAVLLGPRPCF